MVSLLLNNAPRDIAVIEHHIQIGHNPLNAEPGDNMEMGERRLKIVTQPIGGENELTN